ncbi:hypothetical protein MHBO_003838 [Bonamia ostreae]|uniref:Uncharacterized protein n=1 Tax=Bonamia ostreae TaxID=126728 RepID=A0ABV2ARM4_9EUKA
MFMLDGKCFEFAIYPVHLFYVSVGDLKAAVLELAGVLGGTPGERRGSLLDPFQIVLFERGTGWSRGFISERSLWLYIKSTLLGAGDSETLGDALAAVEEPVFLLRCEAMGRAQLERSASFVWQRVMYAQTKHLYLRRESPLPPREALGRLSALQLLADFGVACYGRREVERALSKIVPEAALREIGCAALAESVVAEVALVLGELEAVEGKFWKRREVIRLFNKAFAGAFFAE